jgi:hypothetical protein
MVQKVVNTKLALGVPGNFHDDAPSKVRTYVLAADNSVGNALVVDGKFVGILVNTYEHALKGGLDASVVIKAGDTCGAAYSGNIVVITAAAAAIGDGVAYDNTTFAITAAPDGTAPEGATLIPNAVFAFYPAEAGELAVVSLNGLA